MASTAKNIHYPATSEETPAPPSGLLVSDHFRARYPYRVVRKQGSADWVLTFTLRGRGLYQQAGVRLEALPGDLVLLEPGAYHDYSCPKGAAWEFVWAHFLVRPHWSQWLGRLNLPAVGKGLYRLSIPDRAARQRVRAAFFRCLHDSRSGPSGFNEELALNALEEVLLLASREQTLANREHPLTPEIRRSVEYLADHLAHPHSVTELAEMTGLSPSRFAHRFKAETGDAVIAYLLKLRLRQAARLLEFSEKSVKAAARDVGFESPFYFSRQFKKLFGQAPREFVRARAQASRRRPPSAPIKITKGRPVSY